MKLRLRYSIRAMMILVAAVGILTVCIRYYFRPPPAKPAWIRITNPKSLWTGEPEMTKEEYSEFIETRLDFIRNPAVIDRALVRPKVAQLSALKSMKDPVKWLSSRVELTPVREGVFSITVRHSDPTEAAVLANAVAVAFVRFSVEKFEKEQGDLLLVIGAEIQRQRELVVHIRLTIQNIRARMADEETASDTQRDQAELAMRLELEEAELALEEKLLMQLVERRHRIRRREIRSGRPDVVILRKASP